MKIKFTGLKKTEEGLVKFQFKFAYVKERLFVVVPVNSYKDGSFMVHVSRNLYKIVKSNIEGM